MLILDKTDFREGSVIRIKITAQGHQKIVGLGYVHYLDCGNTFMII